MKTPKTDLEVSLQLALAIGWPKQQLGYYTSGVYTLTYNEWGSQEVDEFSYLDWNVAGPIAARYACFPQKNCFGNWDASVDDLMLGAYQMDTPQKAIALAVINAFNSK